MPDFKDAFQDELASLSAATELDGTELFWATDPNNVKVPSSLVRNEDPLPLVEGLTLYTHNPTVGGDTNSRRAVDMIVTANSAETNPNFSNEQALTLIYRGMHGQGTLNLTTAKKTFIPVSISGVYHASGQKFALGMAVTSYGMSDSALFGNNPVTFAGGPIVGDEGQGFQLNTRLQQQQSQFTYTIAAVVQSAYTANTTQAITASKDSQTITVDTTAGAVVGDWVVIGQQIQSNADDYEAVKIEAIGAGTITAKFYFNHSSGVTITPALVLDLSTHHELGQDRFLINMTQPAYSTGTAAGQPAGTNNTITGVGTNWTTGMVGGNALNVGAITLEADDYAANPYSVPTPLKSWHKILAVTSTTTLTILSMSVAGDQSYKGKSAGVQGNYSIRQAAKVFRVEDVNGSFTGRVICETSTSTWSVGDSVMQPICPYPDVTGFQYSVEVYTPCGTLRDFFNVRNSGGQRLDSAYSCGAIGPISGAPGVNGADTVAWNDCFRGSHCSNGLRLFQFEDAGIILAADEPTIGHIVFGTTGHRYIALNAGVPGTSPAGTFWRMLDGDIGDLGNLEAFGETVYLARHPRLKWNGALQPWPKLAAFLPTADADHKGCIATVTDCNTTTWGATVAGGGSNTVLAFCNGTAWTVMGI